MTENRTEDSIGNRTTPWKSIAQRIGHNNVTKLGQKGEIIIWKIGQNTSNEIDKKSTKTNRITYTNRKQNRTKDLKGDSTVLNFKLPE